jgi:hypothetical protein
MAAAAFWIGLAAFLIAAGYFKVRGEALRHETLRRVIEKTGEVDEERLRELLQPPPPPDPSKNPWMTASGDSYRFLRGFGLVVLAAAIGLVLFFTIVDHGGAIDPEDVFIGYGVASLIAMVGLGIFLSSRYCEKPPRTEPERKDSL